MREQLSLSVRPCRQRTQAAHLSCESGRRRLQVAGAAQLPAQLAVLGDQLVDLVPVPPQHVSVLTRERGGGGGRVSVTRHTSRNNSLTDMTQHGMTFKNIYLVQTWTIFLKTHIYSEHFEWTDMQGQNPQEKIRK